MANILTGIQNTGTPHLGNILSALLPIIQKSNGNNLHLLFIADLHTLTTNKNTPQNYQNTQAIVAACLALGLDTEKIIFYRQSKIREVCELAWYISCFTPFPMMANAHAFKEKSKNKSNINIGLFTYPILMAADILLYNVDQVLVGIDQKQHIEIARDLITKINDQYNIHFNLPKPIFDQNISLVVGTDGRKMSKSYQNTIDIFASEKLLKKKIMSITTDSTPLEQPKNYTTCNIFALYKLLASQKETLDLQKKYQQDNYGYGNAKKALYTLIMEKFSAERKKFNDYIKNPALINKYLEQGEQKAQKIAQKNIQLLRQIIIG